MSVPIKWTPRLGFPNAPEMQKKLLVFCPYSMGGLADYGRAQGAALAMVGELELLWLAPTDLEAPMGARTVGALKKRKNGGGAGLFGKIRRGLVFLEACVDQIVQLNAVIENERPDAVLMVSYSEYFSPLWAGKLRRWQRKGVRFGAVVHDPVRDYQVGPAFWHRWSIAQAYSFLDVAYVHEPIELDTVRPMPGLRTEVVPHGLYHFKTERRSRSAARTKLDLPARAVVFLSFGHIRDGKNLDQFIGMMVEFPAIHLIVAGREQSAGQKPGSFYRELADQLGVGNRIVWAVRHIDESETGWFFGAADFLLLTYSADFRSASGVLAAAAQFEVPVLASSGRGPLESAVKTYHLGHWIEPDDPNALRVGIKHCLEEKFNPKLASFEADHSWERNAEMVIQTLLTVDFRPQ